MMSLLASMAILAYAKPQRCLTSYYETGNNVPTPSSSRYNGQHVLTNTNANEIVQVQTLYAEGLTVPIGYVYKTGDGTLFVSGLKQASAAQRNALIRLYKNVAPPRLQALAEEALYTTLVRLPVKFDFAASHYRLRLCAGA